MKQKIKEALKTRAKNLGLDDSAFDGVAAFGETIVKEEADIDGFLNSEATMNLLKTYQSVADKARAAVKAKNDPETKPSDNGNQPNPNPEPPKPESNPADMAKIIADAVAAAIKPISDELAGFKAEKAVNDTIATVNSRIDAWGYGKGYPKEMEKARKNAMELYEAYGKKWTPDELEAKIKEKFNMEVHDKGLDTSKPFESDGGGGETDADFSSFERAAQKLGWTEPDK